MMKLHVGPWVGILGAVRLWVQVKCRFEKQWSFPWLQYMIVFDSVTRRDLLPFFVPEWRWEMETPAGTIRGASRRESGCVNIAFAWI
jgi:hypothetical protein